MCRFITAVVPSDTNFQDLKPLLEKYEMSFEEIKNSSVEAQFDGDLHVRATRSHCDCNSALGSASNQQEASQQDVTHRAEVAKLRKKGWSEHKIERWLVEKIGSTDRNQQQEQNKKDAELMRWREFIDAMLSGGFTKRFGLLLHMYGGALEDERIQIKGKERILLSEQFDNAMLTMDEDVLYMVSKT